MCVCMCFMLDKSKGKYLFDNWLVSWNSRRAFFKPLKIANYLNTEIQN